MRVGDAELDLDLVVDPDADVIDLRPLARLLIDIAQRKRQAISTSNTSASVVLAESILRPESEGDSMALLKVSSGGVPAGSYTGSFAGVEGQAADAAKGYGPGLRWKWTITAGQYVGQTASRVTSETPSPKNACGKMLSGLLGRALKEGEMIDPDLYIGKPYMLVVAAGRQGGTRVEAVVPVPSA